MKWNNKLFWIEKETKQVVYVHPILAIARIILTIVVLIVVGTANAAEQRKTIGVYNDGTHIMIPEIGECNNLGHCVLSESYTKQWDGAKWIHQEIDYDGDGICDMIRTWKPIVDPTYGIFYTMYRVSPCNRN